jgi:hypothetical protein
VPKSCGALFRLTRETACISLRIPVVLSLGLRVGVVEGDTN